jgi:D-glycero-D-manno-heptose 1,7-bisphosphate phosphatase
MPARSTCSGHDVNAQPKPGFYIPAEVASAASETVRRALFLDRDGVINVNRGYVHTAEQTEWVPGIFELCKAARDAGYGLIVVTNQAGIARGYYSEMQFRDYTTWMHQQFEARGVPLLATFYCPHHPEAGQDSYRTDCDCRKPRPGMLLRAAAELRIDLAKSVMIGDSPSDMAAADAAGIPLAILRSDAGPQLGRLASVFASIGADDELKYGNFHE